MTTRQQPHWYPAVGIAMGAVIAILLWVVAYFAHFGVQDGEW